MTHTVPTTTAPPPAPICVACIGDRPDSTTGRPCQRGKGTGIDPDPLASAGIAVAS